GTNASFGWETTIPFNAATDSPIALTAAQLQTLQSVTPATAAAAGALASSILASCTTFTCSGAFQNTGFIGHTAAGAKHPVPVQPALMLLSRPTQTFCAPGSLAPNGVACGAPGSFSTATSNTALQGT